MTDEDYDKIIEELEANLAKAVEWFDEIRQHCANFGRGVPAIDERIVERCEDTAASAIAELTSSEAANGEAKGGKDENSG